MKNGLVLEGGAMRGLFTAGIIDVMMENHVTFDGIVGVSAGAAFGCNYKSNQPGRVVRYNVKYSRDPRFCSFRSFIRTGSVYGPDFCYHEIPESLDIFDVETYHSSPMKFHVVCTDVTTGEPIYRQLDNGDYNDLEWIRASSSLPLFSRVVELDGFKMLDGGITDSIPLRYSQSIGYERNVVILTQPLDFVKRPSKTLPLIKLFLRKYPKFVAAAEKRHEMYNETLEYIKNEERRGNTLVIRPDEKIPVGHIEHDPDRLRAIYDIGQNKGKAEIAKIKAFLNE